MKMMSIDAFLDQLYALGKANDAVASNRDSKMFNITPATGEFLNILIHDARPRSVLEIGTSNGYSSIWIARACQAIGATFHTVERSPAKIEQAKRNLSETGLLDSLTMVHGDAGEFLADAADQEFDMVFLDSDRSQYITWLPNLLRITRFGQWVVDNATSHLEEMLQFRIALNSTEGLGTVILPIGNGLLITTSNR
jgi:predicted O-methyltransferase YrrM